MEVQNVGSLWAKRMSGAGSDSQEILAASALSAIRLMGAHYGLWFAETARKYGLEKALAAEGEAGDVASGIALKRLGFQGNPFASLDTTQLEALLDTLGKVWLAMDGVWFQAVEKLDGMEGAKQVNDACWNLFAPLEALRAKAVLGLPERGGLDALEAALAHRLHSRISEVAFSREAEDGREGEGALILGVLKCRVQAARRRKGLEDYPCKSAGMVEYGQFARFIDPRISTVCLACPPDALPEGTFCSWRFRLEDPAC